MEQGECRVEFSGMKTHAGHLRKEMKDEQANEAARNKNNLEYYIKIPKSVVMSEQKEQRVNFWQREWTETTKRAKKFILFQKTGEPLVETERNTNLTTIVRGHINIKIS